MSTGNITVAVEPANGHVFGPSEAEVREYDAFGAVAPSGPVDQFKPVNGNVRGVAIDGTAGLLYLSNSASQTIEVWWEPPLPEPITTEADPVAAGGATLNGTVNPNGHPVTECFFKYGPSTSYGAQAPCAEYETPLGSEEWQPLGTPAELGEGSAPVPVRSPVSLESGTTYHFQLYAANEYNAPGEQVPAAI